MSQLVHISSISPPGLLPDKKYLGASHVGHVQFSRNAGILLRNLGCDLRISVICAVGPNNQRKSSDYSRQNRVYTSKRNRKQNNEKESYDTTDLSSKNGPMSQPSNHSRYQANAVPGQREKEIVELFRKVQAQLRQRVAVNKEEKIAEPPQQVQGEKGSVDSLLKLLRKHSTNKEKKQSNVEYNVEQTERDNPFEEEANSNFFELNSFPSEEGVEENASRVPYRRPASNFQRRSPITKAKSRPIRSADETNVTAPYPKATGKQGEKNDPKESSVAEMETRESIFFDDNEEEFEEEESESSEIDDDDDDDDDDDEESVLSGIGIDELEEAPEPLEKPAEASTMAISELESMKVAELRQLAKSRGMKRYSSMKKADLISLLSGGES